MNRILADENITGLDRTFAAHGAVQLCAGRTLTADDLRETDVLLVRSVTPVNRALLEESRVGFVGTATIGTDHLDIPWLDQAGICWASAPGCNADAAAQYTLGMMFLACERTGKHLQDNRVAIVGHGNVGSRLHRLLSALNVEVVVCDPPMVAAGMIRGIPFKQALEADIVSLHVPLTTGGRYPTLHMVNQQVLEAMRPGSVLINAARGEVVDGEALLKALDKGHIHAALDVWPSEPRIDPRLLEACCVSTPHVAGYSVEGKERGTRMIYEAYLAWHAARGGPSAGLGRTTRVSGQAHPEGKHDELMAFDPELDSNRGDDGRMIPHTEMVGDADGARSLPDLVISATHVREDDARMRNRMPRNAESFDPLRRAHAPRHEFFRQSIANPEPAMRAQIHVLGFQVD